MNPPRNFRQQLTKSFIRVGVMHLLGIPLTLLISIVLARTLGPQAFGQYAFVMALLSLMTLPVAAGLPQLLTREVAAYSQSYEWPLYRGVRRAANLWVMLVSLGVLALYVIADSVFGWLPTEGKWALLGIVVLLVPIRGLNAVRNGTVKGLGYPARAEFPTQIFQPLILLMALAIFSSSGELTARHALWFQVFVGTVTFVIASILFVKVRPKAAKVCQPSYQTRAWLITLLPFAMISLGGMLSTQIGIVLLGLLGTDEAVAALRVAERGAQFVALSLSLVNMVISPHIVKIYWEGDSQRLQQLSRQSARGAFMIALPIGLALIVLGRPIIRLTFGGDYAEMAYPPMVILVCGQLFNVALGSVGLLLAMSGHEKQTLVGQFAGLCTTVILAFVLIPGYREVGASIAAASGLLVWNCVLGYAVAKRLNIRPGIF